MIKKINPVFAAATVSITLLSQGVFAAEEQFFPLPSYRVGAYGSTGMPWFAGFIDYLNYINIKEKGVNGVQLTYEECETEYNNAKGVEHQARHLNMQKRPLSRRHETLARQLFYTSLEPERH